MKKTRKTKKSVLKLGTYSNKGLGIATSVISEDVLKEMTLIVQRDIATNREDFIKQMHRLESFIKKNVGVISRDNDFVNWFFDKKKINEWGNNLPEISDEEIIQHSFQYKHELNDKLKRIESEMNDIATAKGTNPREDSICLHFKWQGSQEQRSRVYKELIKNGFISSQTTEEVFDSVFCVEPMVAKGKIIWTKITPKSKTIDKKSISQFINELIKNNLLPSNLKEKQNIFLKLLTASFTGIKDIKKFTASNLSTETSPSKTLNEIESVIKNSL